jgi:peptidoglycan/xylan/chitin deacetylase (PgdA/CDA1 family)
MRVVRLVYELLTGYPPKKRPTGRRKHSAPIRPLVIVCGVIAGLYLVYRIGSVIVPIVQVADATLFPKQPVDVVCSTEKDEEISVPSPILSANYEKRLQDTAGQGPQMVANSSFGQIDQESGYPVGFSHTIDNAAIQYGVLKDSDGTSFLRTMNGVAVEAGASPGWELEGVGVAAQSTYKYSFWYRSSAEVDVSLEAVKSGATTYTNVTKLPVSSEWQQFTGHFANFEDAQSFRFDATLSHIGQLDIKAPTIVRIADAQLSQGMVSFTFDDGWQSAHDKAVPLLRQYGFRSTFYIISDVAKYQEGGYMNLDELRELRNQGNEIGSHSLRHCDLTRLDTQQLQQDLSGSKRSLEEGQVGPIESFAYPLGSYDPKVQTQATETYAYVRSSDAGYNDRYFDHANIHSMGLTDKTSIKDLQQWLEYAKVHKVWLVLVYHRFDESSEYNLSASQFEQHLRLIRASGLAVLPVSEAAHAVK